MNGNEKCLSNQTLPKNNTKTIPLHKNFSEKFLKILFANQKIAKPSHKNVRVPYFFPFVRQLYEGTFNCLDIYNSYYLYLYVYSYVFSYVYS